MDDFTFTTLPTSEHYKALKIEIKIKMDCKGCLNMLATNMAKAISNTIPKIYIHCNWMMPLYRVTYICALKSLSINKYGSSLPINTCHSQNWDYRVVGRTRSWQWILQRITWLNYSSVFLGLSFIEPPSMMKFLPYKLRS